MSEMNPLEAAEKLERWAQNAEWMAHGSIKSKTLSVAASYLRRVASGEYKKVVRCKDCIAWEEKEGYFPRCLIRDQADFRPHKDGFCDMGKRKPGDST